MISKNLGKIFQVSLAIFAMLFGAGNLMFPLRVGLIAGDKAAWAISGFILTGVLLPLLGLLAIIAFGGDYKTFFERTGKFFGNFLIFFCVMTIGPLIIIPRIVGLSYEMLQPFLPKMHVGIFSFLFLTLVFLATYKPRRLLTLIGKYLSPLKVASLCIIIFAGIFTGLSPSHVSATAGKMFSLGINYGYLTVDLIGAIFFGSIVVKLLNFESEDLSMRQRIKIASISAVGAGTLLALVYIGMACLGAFHGLGLEHLNEGQLFSTISFRVLGHYGAALIGFTIFIACFVTGIALTSVATEYFGSTVFKNKFSYINVLIGVLLVTLIPASFGLSAILKYSIPVIVTMYPVVIAVVVCNILYKLFGFPYIKIPVYLTFIFVVLKGVVLLSFHYAISWLKSFFSDLFGTISSAFKK